jgi:hypothetical protein
MAALCLLGSETALPVSRLPSLALLGLEPAQVYARQDIRLDRSTLADWVGRAAWYLRPLRDHVLEKLRRSERLFADETTAPVLDPGRGRTKTGQLR